MKTSTNRVMGGEGGHLGKKPLKQKQNPKPKPIHPWDPDPMAAVRFHKLPFYAKNNTPGDGNCFYHAIADQIVNNPGVYETVSTDAKQCVRHDQLRKMSINFIGFRIRSL